jgi:pimeloyl-ACP methyl ester carboxylesterase
MPTFLFVPGAWLGGWCWRDVATPLRAAGHLVIDATLTGLGERAHLLNPQIGLQTHVADIVGLLHYRDLNGVSLVGHSYGGIVITAVAEWAPERIRRLVYLDASVPRDGESNDDVVGAEMAARLRSDAQSRGEGWRVPPAEYVLTGLTDAMRVWVEERLTPHPLRSFAEPVQLRSQAAAALPRAFIRTLWQTYRPSPQRGLVLPRALRRALCNAAGGADGRCRFGRIAGIASSRTVWVRCAWARWNPRKNSREEASWRNSSE